jgi:3-oxoacyl-[acyl-carrier protein] reductase
MGKTQIITGGTSGIGQAIVWELLRQSSDCDDRIIVNYGHREDAVQELLTGLDEASREKLLFFKADLSQRTELCRFVEDLAKLAPRIDSLILNVGVGTYKPFLEYDFEDWDRVLETNLTLPVFLVQRLADSMVAGGGILFMGSYAGVVPYSSSLAYGVSKAGLLFAAKALLKEFEGRDVRINALAPGFIETRWQVERSNESRERIQAKVALHRFGEVAEVAQAACALLNNSYINGAVLEVHGGYGYL